jgi:hypothetical protein
MELFVVVVKKNNSKIFTAGIFDKHSDAMKTLIPYSDKYGQHNVWIAKHVLNEAIVS